MSEEKKITTLDDATFAELHAGVKAQLNSSGIASEEEHIELANFALENAKFGLSECLKDNPDGIDKSFLVNWIYRGAELMYYDNSPGWSGRLDGKSIGEAYKEYLAEKAAQQSAATAPDAGTATAPDAGTATAPDAGTATAPDAGTTTAPDAGTATTPDAESKDKPAGIVDHLKGSNKGKAFSGAALAAVGIVAAMNGGGEKPVLDDKDQETGETEPNKMGFFGKAAVAVGVIGGLALLASAARGGNFKEGWQQANSWTGKVTQSMKTGFRIV